MRLWVVHMNGFTPETWPVVSLPRLGSVKNLKHKIDEAGSETRVVFVGTGGKYTKKHEKGKLLGLVDIHDMPIFNTEEVIDEKHKWSDENKTERSEIYNDAGMIRWPTGIAIKRSWYFKEPPDAKSEHLLGILNAAGKKVFYNPNLGIGNAWEVEDKKRVENILNLPRGDEIYPNIDPAQADWTGLPTGPTQGPIPANRKNQLAPQNAKPKNHPNQAYTYVLRFADSDCYKIGRTIDLNRRLSEINAHIPIEILGEEKSWRQYFSHAWEDEDCEQLAHDCENYLRNLLLEDHRTYGERVKCDKSKMKWAWNKAIRQTS